MTSHGSILPAHIHATAAKLEDGLIVWRSRPPGLIHPKAADSLDNCIDLCNDMISHFEHLKTQLFAEKVRYGEQVNRA